MYRKGKSYSMAFIELLGSMAAQSQRFRNGFLITLRKRAAHSKVTCSIIDK